MVKKAKILTLQDDDFTKEVKKIFDKMELFSVKTKRGRSPTRSDQRGFQIDILVFYEKTCFVIECKTGGAQRVNPNDNLDEFNKKIDRIGKKIHEQRDSINVYLDSLGLSKLIQKFNAKHDKDFSIKDIKNFENIEFLYVHNRFLKKEAVKKYPGYYSKFHLWDVDDVMYYREVSKTLGNWAKYEILGEMITLNDIIDDRSGFPVLRVKEKFGKNRGDTYYVFSMKPIELLRRARVWRNTSRGFKGTTYQRLLSDKKLNDIANFYDSKENKVPHLIGSIIVSLDIDTNNPVRHGTIYLPKKHNSISIVDGQHRLYAFTRTENKDLLDTTEFIVTGFKSIDSSENIEKQARIFIDINKNQKPVHKDLLFDVSYRLLKDRSSAAIASEILNRMNDKQSSIFRGMIKTNPLGLGTIKKTSIISYGGLKKLIEYRGSSIGSLAAKFDNKKLTQLQSPLDFEEKERYYESYIEFCMNELNKFFMKVSKTFHEEWKDTNNSKFALISVVGISSFIGLYSYFMNSKLTEAEMLNKLKEIKNGKMSFLKKDIPTSGSKWSLPFIQMLIILDKRNYNFIDFKKLTPTQIKQTIKSVLDKSDKLHAEKILNRIERQLGVKHIKKLKDDPDIQYRLIAHNIGL